MIKKLQTWQRPLPNNPVVVENMGMDNKSLFDKINELVDAVNEIMTWRFETDEDSDWYDDPKHREPTDPYAEQRKWIGKICKFWDIDNNNLYYGPLTKIHDTSPYCYECNHKMCYAFCEPVKDDVIYKGGNNE